MVLRQVGPASAGKATRWTRCGVHYVEPIEGQLRGWGTRPEFEPSSLALLECNALWRPARPGLQSRARAAIGPDAPYRRAHGYSRGRTGVTGSPRGVPSGAAAIGLDRRSQPADRVSPERGRCRTPAQRCRSRLSGDQTAARS
jgi:hypothetical protein